VRVTLGDLSPVLVGARRSGLFLTYKGSRR
jgi:hypothetical protein